MPADPMTDEQLEAWEAEAAIAAEATWTPEMQRTMGRLSRTAVPALVAEVQMLRGALGALIEKLPRCEATLACEETATWVHYGYDGRVEYRCAPHANKARPAFEFVNWGRELLAARAALPPAKKSGGNDG